ncbi:MAG: PD-(D/E)XK nuclease family protein, partial [Planctomycetota bacterium]|nr:PD-(D/E)XK nuclease family protein [Planctomycetota bacterium]
AGLRERLEGIAPYDAERFEALLRIAHAWPESSRGRLAPLIAHLQDARTEGASDAQVRVLTIHASKGLEYDAVVLPELGGKMFETPSLVSRRGDAYGPVELLSTYQSRGFQCLDDGLTGLHEWDQEALLTDSLCMLYVAMTRAKRSLDLILPHWRPAKNKSGRDALPNTARWCHFVRFLGTAFEADPASSLLLQEASEVAWIHGLEPREEQPEPAPAPTLDLRPGGALRALPSRSPSAAEGGQRRTVAEWLRGVDEGAVALGTCVHALLERVEWGDSLDLAQLGDEARAGQGSTGQALLEGALDLLDEALVAPELRSLLARPAGDAELWRERRFAVELDGELWSGTFDRVVLHRDAEGSLTHAEVVDWKTDRVTDDGLTGRAEHYRPQLEAYGRVLAAMTGLPSERIALRLAFLRAGRVVDL